MGRPVVIRITNDKLHQKLRHTVIAHIYFKYTEYSFLTKESSFPHNINDVLPHLHEEAGDERLPDVDVVVAGGEVGGAARHVEPVHDPGQLLAHVVGRLQRPVVDEVVVAPVGILHVCGTASQRCGRAGQMEVRWGQMGVRRRSDGGQMGINGVRRKVNGVAGYINRSY